MKSFLPWNYIALPPVLRRFIQVLSILTLLCGAAEFIALRYGFNGARYSYSLIPEFFPDMLFLKPQFAYLHSLRFFTANPLHPFMYPAPVALPYALYFRASPQHALRYFLLSIFAALLFSGYMVTRALRARGLSTTTAIAFVVATMTLAYPFWFLYHQANMEFIVWVVLSLGLWAFFSKRPYLAAICFGVAGSMKLFPFVYLGLLLARRRYGAIAVGVALAIVLTIVSLWFVYPDIRVSWQHIQAGIGVFRETYMLRLRPERGFDHSLFGVLKHGYSRLPPSPVLGKVLSLYLAATALLGVGLYFIRIQKLPVVNQLLCLTVASILLPPTSFDYTLIHLYAPWLLLVFCALERYRTGTPSSVLSALGAAMLCFAILFAPLTELIRHGETAEGPIRAIVLLILFAIALRYPFRSPSLEALAG